MYRASYKNNGTNTINHKGGFADEFSAREWIAEQGNKITALKLLVWDEEIDCYSTVESFSNKYRGCSATFFYKRVYA